MNKISGTNVCGYLDSAQKPPTLFVRLS